MNIRGWDGDALCNTGNKKQHRDKSRCYAEKAKAYQSSGFSLFRLTPRFNVVLLVNTTPTSVASWALAGFVALAALVPDAPAESLLPFCHP